MHAVRSGNAPHGVLVPHAAVKSDGILHAELSGIVAAMGHGELLVIADAGLPVPPGVKVVDLALRPGVPGFHETVRTVLSELVVERGFANAEAPNAEPAAARALDELWPSDVELSRIDHEALKAKSARARAVVRTGEFTPYCNVVLVAGVPF